MNSTDALTLHSGYWCECWTQSPATGEDPVLLAALKASTSSEAVRWIRGAVQTVALSLEPETVEHAWDWIRSGYIADVEALLRNEPCAVDLSYAGTYIGWTARPALFLPVARLKAAELPWHSHG